MIYLENETITKDIDSVIRVVIPLHSTSSYRAMSLCERLHHHEILCMPSMKSLPVLFEFIAKVMTNVKVGHKP